MPLFAGVDRSQTVRAPHSGQIGVRVRGMAEEFSRNSQESDSDAGTIIAAAYVAHARRCGALWDWRRDGCLNIALTKLDRPIWECGGTGQRRAGSHIRKPSGVMPGQLFCGLSRCLWKILPYFTGGISTTLRVVLHFYRARSPR